MRSVLDLDNRLSRTLYQAGLSETELAERAGIARSRLNRIKNRRVEPTVSEALAICRVLERDVAELFWLDGRAGAAGS